MDWEDCRYYCENNPHGPETGHTYYFADILDTEEMECVRYFMNENYRDTFAGHYWIGGHSDYPGGPYKWTSGASFEFNDFVENPGNEQFFHLTPGNNYAWNTQSNRDNNNGCLCKSRETLAERKPKRGGCCWEDECSAGWTQMTEDKCVWMDPDYDQDEMYTGMHREWCSDDPNHDFDNDYQWDRSAVRFCNEVLGAELVEWSDYGEFIAVKALHVESWYSNGMGGVWDGSMMQHWIGTMQRQGGVYRWNSTGEIAVTEQDTEYWGYWGQDDGWGEGAFPDPDDNGDNNKGFCLTMLTGTNGMARVWDMSGTNTFPCQRAGQWNWGMGPAGKPMCMRTAITY